MVKVPTRFLGYSFCIGDILLEMDDDLLLFNADGAASEVFGTDLSKAVGSSVMDFIRPRDHDVIRNAVQNLTVSHRMGPVNIDMKNAIGSWQTFSAFLAKLPTQDKKVYMVLAKPYRIGLSERSDAPEASLYKDEKSRFFEKMSDLFATDKTAAEHLMLTILESHDGNSFGDRTQKDIKRYLGAQSVGGDHAAMLDGDKFAVLHNKDGNISANITAELEKISGVSMQSASIDAAEARLFDADNMRALLFSLQRFSQGVDGFNAINMKDGCSDLLEVTTARIKDFKSMMQKGAFMLVYQPIVDLQTRKVHHYEALTRYDSSDMSMSPFEMICFAEDVGLIDEFDFAVLNRCFEKLIDVSNQGATQLPKIAANLSGRSVDDATFIDKLLVLLNQNKQFSNYLSLEITESAKISNLSALEKALTRVRELGFKVYLDDFGAGSSGFQYLRELTVDALKIDGAYIKDALTSDKDKAFLHAMVLLCRDLGIETVGEWVESADHAKLLHDIGVDFGQGYYFGKPTSGLVVTHS